MSVLLKRINKKQLSYLLIKKLLKLKYFVKFFLSFFITKVVPMMPEDIFVIGRQMESYDDVERHRSINQ